MKTINSFEEEIKTVKIPLMSTMDGKSLASLTVWNFVSAHQRFMQSLYYLIISLKNLSVDKIQNDNSEIK